MSTTGLVIVYILKSLMSGIGDKALHKHQVPEGVPYTLITGDWKIDVLVRTTYMGEKKEGWLRRFVPFARDR